MTAALKLEHISKSFPGVRALADVSFSLRPGEIRALVGENGAGKSTLMKILSGAYSADEGRIELFGEHVVDPTPASMIGRGVAVIYQELAQAPHLTVTENVLMGRLPMRAGLVDWPRAHRTTAEVITRLGFEVDPRARIGDLSVAKRQMVEIAKAIARNARIIVLDEPSAVLAQAEIDQLFLIIRQLAAEDGVAFAYISHRLREVFEISDTVTILRDGKVVHDGPSAAMTTDGLIRSMVGREVGDVFPTRHPRIGAEALAATGLTTRTMLKNAGITLRQGEIVGLFGLAGAGRTELLRAIYGADPVESGELRVKGRTVTTGSPRRGIALGLGLVPEDRKTEGLFLIQSVGFNIMSASLGRILRRGLLSSLLEKQIVRGLIDRLHIKTPNAATAAQNLSGGNQQKCVLARLVSAGCEILLADEPTRGVDVGAKREIYDLLVELAESRGLAILMASSELPEILGLCDRVYVLREGEVTAELDARRTTEEEVMHFAALH
ncbi:sugar ABC transporter ATP-binding protein [Siculibacillus lacustris]|uniref:Sugar ABC transporter ATP-binding protein n=1 Tax=Siculibacillus lacustris TaxID=1549641 RepID=A0A4Q9VG53_9HYPH|nr:sugar ABC transporter ATP-binding protein [Siculibacillus lacustris]TBW33974.1 sugar ABC transporter ATP-binding protein [Siculibacillus lacustris]